MFEKFQLRVFNYVLSASREGLVELRLPHGSGRIYGNVTEKPIVVFVSDWSFFKSVIQEGSSALSSLYDQGIWRTEQVDQFVDFLNKNKKYFAGRLRFARFFYFLIQPWLFFKRRTIPQTETEKYFSSCF